MSNPQFTNFPSMLQSILNFMQQQDQNGTWDELEPSECHIEDIIYLHDTIIEWLSDGLQLTNRVQGYINYLSDIIENDMK